MTKSREPLVVLQRLGNVHQPDKEIEVNARPFYRERETLASTLALRPREAAAALGVSPSTLERLTKAGEIPVVKLGRCRLYELVALSDFLKSRRVVGQEVVS